MHVFRSIIFVLSLAAGLVRVADGQLVEKQWQSLAAFPNKIYVIYFLDLPGPPRIGFAGSAGMVYRTSDGGATWNTTIADNYNYEAWDIVFKDSLIGWFANWSENFDNSQCFKTTDGGLTWKALSAPIYNTTSLFYNQMNKLLFISGWGQFAGKGTLCNSTDDGSTWNTLPQQSDFNGLAFLNLDSGLITHEQGSSSFRSVDGGQSWAIVTTDAHESFQPLADSFRNVYWTASEVGSGYPSIQKNISLIYESFDFGASFKLIDTVPSITGTILEGSCGMLYLQSSPDDQEGILQSKDGLVWSKLLDANGNSGPFNEWDTRFYVAGTYIFAAGRTPNDNSTQIWRYVGDSTKFGGMVFAAPVASTKHFDITSTNCNNLDSLLFIHYQNDCIPAEIESAQLGDTSRFALNNTGQLPTQISGSYPISIEHRPANRTPDSTVLYLSYFANGKTLYDTVYVTGAVTGANIVSPFDVVANGSKNAQVGGGDTVDLRILLTDSLAQIGLDSLRFQTSFDGDMLSFKYARAVSPWTLLNEAHSEGVESITVSHSNTQPALVNSPIADIIYTADVSKNSSTSYLLNDIYLNDIEFKDCATPSSLSVPPVITVSGCGDTLLQQVMMGEPIIQFLNIEMKDGNPTLMFRSAVNAPMEITLFDILGREIRKIEIEAVAGVNQNVTLPVDGLPEGLYFVSIAAGGNTRVSTRFLIGDK